MTLDKAKTRLEQLVGRMKTLLDVGHHDSWKTDKEILMNDIREYAKRTFDKGSVDYREIMGVFSPGGTFISGSEWGNWVRTYGENMETALQVVQHRLREGQSQLKATGQVEHLIEPGTQHTAYVLLRDIVESASRLVFLVDPYVDRTLFSLLSNVASGADVRILTRQGNVPSDFAAEAAKFGQQHKCKLQCRDGLNDFHDRFLIVDDRLFYSGASFKDLGKKESLVGEIEDIRSEIMNGLETRWKSATPLT